MQLPDWAVKVVGVLILLAVVLLARGIGYCCRRIPFDRVRGLVALLLGGGCGAGVGAAVVWAYFEPRRASDIYEFACGFLGLVGGIQAAITASKIEGETGIGVG